MAFDVGGIVELGEVRKEDVPSLIEKADASQHGDKPFGLGLYRNKEDFLEIRPVGNSEYLLWSDLIVREQKGFSLRLLIRRQTHIEKIVSERAAAAEAAYDYFECSREEFEQRYRSF